MIPEVLAQAHKVAAGTLGRAALPDTGGRQMAATTGSARKQVRGGSGTLGSARAQRIEGTGTPKGQLERGCSRDAAREGEKLSTALLRAT